DFHVTGVQTCALPISSFTPNCDETTSKLGTAPICVTGVRSSSMLNGRDLYRCGLTARSETGVVTKLYPSGFILITCPMPIAPTAPGLFSTITDCSQYLDN